MTNGIKIKVFENFIVTEAENNVMFTEVCIHMLNAYKFREWRHKMNKTTESKISLTNFKIECYENIFNLVFNLPILQ